MVHAIESTDNVNTDYSFALWKGERQGWRRMGAVRGGGGIDLGSDGNKLLKVQRRNVGVKCLP